MITVVVGKEIEKIKGDFESYLNGLNMVGEISYSQYSKLYDEGTKQMQRAYELGKSELEKEIAELKKHILILERIKKEHTDYIIKVEEERTCVKERLFKATEIIEGLMRFCRCFAQHHTEDIRYKEAEQFLKECK